MSSASVLSRVRRPLRRALLLALAPLYGGCAMVRATAGGWGEDASGLTRAQRTLRHALADADFPVALAWKDDDAVLQALTGGLTAYYAAQYARSAALLDTAGLLADARITSSVSRAALTMVTNDLARAYEPRRTERLFMSYYAMLSYAQLEQWEDAAVEARRLSALLGQYAPDAEAGDRALAGMMHHLAGAVFERAGERDAAVVAYRNGRALVPGFGEVAHRAPAGTGDVLVIVERGFVAHRVTETIRVVTGALACEESRPRCELPHRRLGGRVGSGVEGLEARVASTRATPGPVPGFRQRDVVAAPAGTVGPGQERPSGGWVNHDQVEALELHREEVRLAFPALYRAPPLAARAIGLAWDGRPPGTPEGSVRVAVDIDEATAVDERRERATVIARELARTAARVAITKVAHEKAGEAGGHIAELGAALLARADVRSWHLLPRELSVIRVRLPAGQHVLSLQAGDGSRITGGGPVTVIAGVVTILPARIWREGGEIGHPPCPAPRPCSW